jgi:hypothetical protein
MKAQETWITQAYKIKYKPKSLQRDKVIFYVIIFIVLFFLI